MSREPDLGQPRTAYGRYRMTPDEKARLTRLRGRLSESDYIRGLVERDANERGIS